MTANIDHLVPFLPETARHDPQHPSAKAVKYSGLWLVERDKYDWLGKIIKIKLIVWQIFL